MHKSLVATGYKTTKPTCLFNLVVEIAETNKSRHAANFQSVGSLNLVHSDSFQTDSKEDY